MLKKWFKCFSSFKNLSTHSQTVQAQGGINAVLYENDDDINLHIEDTL